MTVLLDCSNCRYGHICCVGFRVVLTPEEQATDKYDINQAFLDRRELCVLRKVNNHCVYFDVEKKQCKIWDERPKTCREYDCRTDTRIQHLKK